jgi:hypothetical protein|tara:strand:+ start:758 stop:1078 length:321 start_codon:yes stop_codon:yes gene_type:complete
MPLKPKTPMEKYRAGLPLTPSEERTVQRILERNRLKKINIGRKRSRGAAGMTLGEMKPKRKLAKVAPKKLPKPTRKYGIPIYLQKLLQELKVKSKKRSISKRKRKH